MACPECMVPNALCAPGLPRPLAGTGSRRQWQFAPTRATKSSSGGADRERATHLRPCREGPYRPGHRCYPFRTRMGARASPTSEQRGRVWVVWNRSGTRSIAIGGSRCSRELRAKLEQRLCISHWGTESTGASDATGHHRTGMRGRHTRVNFAVWSRRSTARAISGGYRTHQCRQWGELARLHDDCAAHCERGCDLPGPHLDWIVPWDATSTVSAFRRAGGKCAHLAADADRVVPRERKLGLVVDLEGLRTGNQCPVR